MTENQQQFVFSIESNEDTVLVHSNHIETGCNEYEVTLWFARIPSKPSSTQREQAKTGIVKLNAAVEVVIPTSLLPALIQVLQQQQVVRDQQLAVNSPGSGLKTVPQLN